MLPFTGILETTVQDINDANNEKLVIILHGYLGHKNYLYQRELASRLSMSSYRFDSESLPETLPSVLSWLRDLTIVVDFFKSRNWRIFALVGHSIGSVACLLYAIQNPFVSSIIINVSGRFEMSKNLKKFYGVRDKLPVLYSFNHREKTYSYNIDQQTLQEWLHIDEFLTKNDALLPIQSPVLTIHGLSDTIVPIKDACLWNSRIPNHTLRLIPGDHNFVTATGNNWNLVVDSIIEYISHSESISFFWKTFGCNVVPFHLSNNKMYEYSSRIHFVDGVNNCRDVGGLVGNGLIKRGILYRSGSLDFITNTGIEKLKTLKINFIIDFRSDREISSKRVLIEEDINRVHLPIFSDVYSIDVAIKRWEKYIFGGITGFASAYFEILEASNKTFTSIFKYLAGIDDDCDSYLPTIDRFELQPLLIHCTLGKDRTGVFIALVLNLLNVDDEIIANEYSLTEYCVSWSDQELERISNYTNQRFNAEEIKRLMTAKPAAMREFLDLFKLKFINCGLYLKNELRFHSSHIDAIRERFMDNEVAKYAPRL